MTVIREFEAPPVSVKEIFRYLRAEKGEELDRRVEKCLGAALPLITYKACFAEYPISVSGKTVNLGFAEVESGDLAKCLGDCSTAVVFVATVGIGIDRLMKRYEATSPADALIVSAVGNERVEALCDALCEDIAKEAEKKGCVAKPRFSPGYGDLSLFLERDIFKALGVTKALGISLSEKMLMTPVKSVSAIVGIKNGEKQ